MSLTKVRYRNRTFQGERVSIDGKEFDHCEFKDCIIVVESGETRLSGCRFDNCKLMLRGNAYTVAKIISLFAGKSPLRVLDLDEPLFEEGDRPQAGQPTGKENCR